MSQFNNATARLSIGSCDVDTLHVDAQYNPKELQIDRSIQWSAVKQASQTAPARGDAAAHKGIQLEFTGAEGRSLTIELLFDGYEDGNPDIVTSAIGKLETMASVRDPASRDETQRRPHLCVVSWGQRGLPKFRCVIESLSTKYMMFGGDGAPLRATCTVKLKEADAVQLQKPGR
jgi:hypothetical protein